MSPQPRSQAEAQPAPDRPRRWPRVAIPLLLAATALAVTLTVVKGSPAWEPSGWAAPSQGEAPPERSMGTTRAAPTPLFAADSWHRRAGVVGWMTQLRGQAAPASPVAALPVPYDPNRALAFDTLTTFGGVNYADATGSGIPLQWVGDDADAWLSPGLRLRDFVTHDGAPFARIDPDLIQRLERLRKRAGDLVIVSGYRHPAYNLNIGGHGNSYHTAGRAADVWSPHHSSLELARLALLEMGCDVGIGLNARTIHVDVRGELASWTYEGAPLTEPAFDAWTLVQCGRPVPSWLTQAAAAAWLGEGLGPGGLGPDSLSASNESLGGDSWASRSARPTAEGLLSRHAGAIAEVVRRGAAVAGPGGVVLDFRLGTTPDIRYVPSTSAEADSLGLPPLIAWCTARGNAYVAYAVALPGETLVGVTNELGIGGHAPTRPVAAPAAPDSVSALANRLPSRSAAPLASGPTSSEEGWIVIAGSFGDAADAEARAASLDERLDASVIVVAAPEVGRYRVAVGPFRTPEAASQARARLGAVVPDDAWIAPL